MENEEYDKHYDMCRRNVKRGECGMISIISAQA
jgi:hypothetical protein